MIWQLRFARNVAVSLAPFPQTLRRLKRSVSPAAASLDPWTVEQGLRQVALLGESGFALRGKDVMVFGRLGQPVLPLLFALAGARRVSMLDRGQDLDLGALVDTAERLAEYAEVAGDRLDAAPELVRAALVPPRRASFEATLAHFGLAYHPRCDPASTGLAPASVDVIASRAELEHLRPQTVQRIFAESRRLLATGGRLCHVIDNSDHWSHVDRDISAVNFLRYPEWLWPVFAINPGDYQNRLRHVDYIRMLKAAGFRVLVDPSVPDPVAVAAVRAMRVARRFRRFAPGQLGVMTSYLVAGRAR
jgi:SAM-dependent methyltransferase